VVVDLSVVAVAQQEHREQVQAVLVELAIYMLVELAHQAQEHLLAEAEAVQDLPLLVQMQLLMLAVMVAQAEVVEAQPQH
jgi:hypothetical protein